MNWTLAAVTWYVALGTVLGWEHISKAGEKLGWWCARHQLDRLHQVERLRELQVNAALQRAGAGPVGVSVVLESAVREQARERRCEVCGRPRRKCFRTQLLDADRPAPAGSCLEPWWR